MATDLYSKLGMKEFDQMIADTLQAIVNSGTGITNTSAGTVIRTLVESILDNNDMSNYYISYVYGALGIDDAEGEDLDRLISILGLARYSATYSTGVVTMYTGGEPAQYDIPIPYGSIVSTRQDSNGNIIEFTVSDSDVILTAGNTSVNVNIIAVDAGHIYVPAGALSVLNSSISGIQSVANTAEINSGTDVEDDETLRIRTKTMSKSFGKCTDSAIKFAVEAITGVLSCTIIDMMNGIGTTGVIVSTSIVPPPAELITEITNIVKQTKASGIAAFIVYPTIKGIDLDINISGIEFNVDLVIETISNYVNSLDIGQSFIISQNERKILNALDSNYGNNDDVDIITNVPTSNQVPASTEIIRIDTLTINGTLYSIS
jgi:uncharacterized phage protein gp47/JayE